MSVMNVASRGSGGCVVSASLGGSWLLGSYGCALSRADEPYCAWLLCLLCGGPSVSMAAVRVVAVSSCEPK